MWCIRNTKCQRTDAEMSNRVHTHAPAHAHSFVTLTLIEYCLDFVSNARVVDLSSFVQHDLTCSSVSIHKIKTSFKFPTDNNLTNK